MRCEEVYEQFYHKNPEAISFCPYRVSPLGAHIDHQNGKINGFAIDKGIYIAYSPKHNGVIELQSINFQKRAQFHVNAVPDVKEGDWADHLRGATKVLNEKYPLRNGISAVIEGTMPIGGLSSSASVIIAFLSALARANGITLGQWETIMMAKEAENKYVGVNCGKLDQSCEVLCKKNELLYLDCADDSFKLIPKSENMAPFKIGVFFSGLDRSLANSQYNLRQDECKAAAYVLMAHAGMDYGKFQEARLRDVPRKVYEEHKDKLPYNFRKRAEHFYTEMERVEKGIEAWTRGELDRYGALVFESGESSVKNYECGCPELISLYNILTKTDGVYGGRFSGAGFKGCCMSLIDPNKVEEIEANVTRQYLKEFPALEGKYSFHLCDVADGVKL